MFEILRMRVAWVKRHAWLLLLLVTIGLFLCPVAYRSSRMLLLVCLAVLWVLGAFQLRRRKMATTAIISAGVICLGWLCLPGRPADPAALRRTYVQCLKEYEGTIYFWGGENRIGIDCSGLVRRGLINANTKLGLLTLNPRLVRAALSLWWYDCSARALRDEYRNYTLRISTADSINEADHNTIEPGDLAVTSDGIHVLAYIGDSKWIAADPGARRVIIEDIPSENIWFSRSVQMTRWRQIKDPGTGIVEN
jgi:hypothetical protein